VGPSKTVTNRDGYDRNIIVGGYESNFNDNMSSKEAFSPIFGDLWGILAHARGEKGSAFLIFGLSASESPGSFVTRCRVR
jgi:hypothetical protein